jgi:hypothetical protein
MLLIYKLTSVEYLTCGTLNMVKLHCDLSLRWRYLLLASLDHVSRGGN